MNENINNIILSDKLKAIVDKYQRSLAIDREFEELKEIYRQIKVLKSRLAKADRRYY